MRGKFLPSIDNPTKASTARPRLRTLHRQLHEEGASLQALKDEVRRDQAMQALRRSSRPIKQVALAVGFRSEKSFSRAFKEWTGEAPAEYRRRVAEG